jgi:hypothetical protein
VRLSRGRRIARKAREKIRRARTTRPYPDRKSLVHAHRALSRPWQRTSRAFCTCPIDRRPACPDKMTLERPCNKCGLAACGPQGRGGGYSWGQEEGDEEEARLRTGIAADINMDQRRRAHWAHLGTATITREPVPPPPPARAHAPNVRIIRATTAARTLVALRLSG